MWWRLPAMSRLHLTELTSMNVGKELAGFEAYLSLDASALEVVAIVFRPGYLMALFAMGWAANVAIFGQFRIDYCSVLGINKEEAVSPGRLVMMSATLAFSLAFLRLSLMSAPSILAVLFLMPFAYVSGIIGLFTEWPAVLDQRLRWRVPLTRALRRSVRPDSSRDIPFVEVLVADGLTSMAKVFFDLAVSGCVAVHPFLTSSRAAGSGYAPYGPLPNGTAVAAAASGHHGLWGDALQECRRSGFPYFLWAVPFLIRVRQCTVSARHAPDSLARDMQRVNLLKYMTALPVIAFSFCYVNSGAGNSEFFVQEDFEFMWALAAVVNSLFSFLWDLVMDWGLLQAGAERFGLRSVLLFHGAWGVYYVLIVINLVGRTLWSLRWSTEATVLLGTFVLGTLQQAAEVVRRCLWNILRVEWECIKKGAHRMDKQFPV